MKTQRDKNNTAPGGVRRSQEEPGGARRGQEEPGGVRRSQVGQGGACSFDVSIFAARLAYVFCTCD